MVFRRFFLRGQLNDIAYIKTVLGMPPAPFGRYQNVLLSESEYAELKGEYPDRLERLIEEMSEYIAASGNDYVCHQGLGTVHIS